MSGAVTKHRASAIGALALAVLATACGGGSKKVEAGGAYGDGVDVRSTTTLAPGQTGPAPTTAPGATSKLVTPASTAKGSPATTTKAAPSNTATLPPVSGGSGNDPIKVVAKQGSGAAAGMMLSATSAAKQLVVEVIASPGATEITADTDRVANDLRTYSGKPVQIVRTAGPATANDKQWTPSDLNQWVDTYSKVPQGGSTFVIHHAYVHGHLPSGSSGFTVLGVAYRADSFAYFADDASSLSSTEKMAVAVHENGHLMGLVDTYLNDGRSDTTNDPAKHGHSQNKQSVMYYAVDSTLISQLLGTTPTDFDAADKRDLAAIHNGAAPGAKAG
jgi:hypothetical protein